MRIGLDDILVDTNVLVYVYDPRDHRKQQRAVDVLGQLIDRRAAAVSAQCLSEFFSVSTRGLRERLSKAEARTRVEGIASSCRVLAVTDAIVLEGCRGTVQHGLSIWDALIWSAAKLNQIRYVLTEDARHGRRIETVTFLDPFDPSFVLPE